MEDILKLKEDNDQHPNCALMLDELSEFMGKLSQDPTFEPNFLSMYTAKVCIMLAFKVSGLIAIFQPMRANIRGNKDGLAECRNPHVQFGSFTQSDTLLEIMTDRGIDRGGRIARLNFMKFSNIT